MAIRNDWKHICVESDSSIVIRDIVQEESLPMRWDIGAIVQDVIGMSISFHSCSFNWINRSCNELTNKIAKMTLQNTCPRDWTIHPDMCILELLSKFE